MHEHNHEHGGELGGMPGGAQQGLTFLHQQIGPYTQTVPGENTHTPRRRRLSDERASITHKFQIGDQKGYLTVGLYDDGSPGELFIVMDRDGSVVSGLVNSLAATTSIALQYGVPLEALVKKFAHVRFEPSGYTNNAQIKVAKSIVDYIFRWLGMRFLEEDRQRALGIQ